LRGLQGQLTVTCFESSLQCTHFKNDLLQSDSRTESNGTGLWRRKPTYIRVLNRFLPLCFRVLNRYL